MSQQRRDVSRNRHRLRAARPAEPSRPGRRSQGRGTDRGRGWPSATGVVEYRVDSPGLAADAVTVPVKAVRVVGSRSSRGLNDQSSPHREHQREARPGGPGCPGQVSQASRSLPLSGTPRWQARRSPASAAASAAGSHPAGHGMHVHVAVPSRETGLQVLNRILVWRGREPRTSSFNCVRVRRGQCPRASPVARGDDRSAEAPRSHSPRGDHPSPRRLLPRSALPRVDRVFLTRGDTGHPTCADRRPPQAQGW